MASDPKRVAELNARHAAKVAARKDGAPTRTYAASPRSGVREVKDAAYRAKIEARIAAFNAGRKPDASGTLDVSKPKQDAAKSEAKITPEAALKALDEATRPEAKPEPKRGSGKG